MCIQSCYNHTQTSVPARRQCLDQEATAISFPDENILRFYGGQGGWTYQFPLILNF